MPNFITSKLGNRHLDEVVWAVGHCPPGGIETELAHGITSEAGQQRLLNEIVLHLALLTLVRDLRPHFTSNSRIVVIGSAVTRLDGLTPLPPGFNIFHHVAAAKTLQGIVAGLRYEAQGEVIHLLEPGAVDTPFHHTANPAHRPPKLLSVGRVVEEAVSLLQNDTPTTKVLLPE